MSNPLVSIIIDNYNYGGFLRDAIDSALAQTYVPIEVIVVDDGSVDNSRETIESYGDRIIPVFKKNGGHASAFNAGYDASNGELVCFLDADDICLSNKVDVIVRTARTCASLDESVMFHHRLATMDRTGAVRPGLILGRSHPSAVNFYPDACKYAFPPNIGECPTSGLCLTRKLAARIFPLPETIRMYADDFLVYASAVIGTVCSVDEVLGAYRIHGTNIWWGKWPAKSEQFMRELDRFLNGKLAEAGKEPVVSFFDSLYAGRFYLQHGLPGEIFPLTARILARRIDRRTIAASLKLLTLSALFWPKAILKSAVRYRRERAL